MSFNIDHKRRIQRPVKYKFNECPNCGEGFTIDPGSSSFTADHGDPVRCPWCGYLGTVVKENPDDD